MSVKREAARYLPLVPHDFQILLSLLDRDLHGYSLIKDISERTGGEMVLGTSTLYSAVKRMVQCGLLAEAEGQRDEGAKGPPRRYYGITGLGREVAQQEGLRIRRLDQMVAGTSLLEGGGGRVVGVEEAS